VVNAIEELKKQVDGLDVWSHIEEASKVGFEAVDQKLVPLFKWYGVYAQKPNEEGFFMLRVKIPGGQLHTVQIYKLAELGKRYARSIVDITTRQAVQMHWIRINDMPQILKELKDIGLDTAGGCGDITRNITGCPLAGLAEDEVFDASHDLKAIDAFFNRNKDYSNLPRKYKMSVTGCSHWCSQPDINCASLVGVKHPKTAELGYSLKVGGGLSTKPMIARNFPVFIKREQAKEVIAAVTAVYRDHGFRDKRAHARIKYLIEDWGTEKFLDEVEKVLGKKLERVPALRTMNTGALEYFPSPVESHFDHLGLTKLKNGNFAIGIAFISGRSRDNDLFNVAKLAEKYSTTGEVRTTNKQNLILVNVPPNKVDACLQDAKSMNLKVEHSAFTRLGVACTGTEFCNLAIVETKARAKKLFDYLDTEFPGLQEQMMISVTGCPNNCAQYSIADIGLVGCKVKNAQDEMVDAFRMHLGGRLCDEAQFAQAVGVKRFFHENIHLTLKTLLDFYFNSKKTGEEFRHFVDRVGLAAIEGELAALN
jgi:ferredoxin-nitrite reductase